MREVLLFSRRRKWAAGQGRESRGGARGAEQGGKKTEWGCSECWGWADAAGQSPVQLKPFGFAGLFSCQKSLGWSCTEYREASLLGLLDAEGLGFSLELGLPEWRTASHLFRFFLQWVQSPFSGFPKSQGEWLPQTGACNNLINL